uniref:Antitoxin n=1 Tax=Candidatus Kentrum sp. LFY TaxID=2126342 RepID=A0A450UR00_9GAMM|nr:MAG: hypothetical protein BECKLFY1418B_GA0070995_106416 [Candidatus Kentron sp. LFY]
MDSELTLKMDDTLVQQAKYQAARRGKSFSRMFGEFVHSLPENTPREQELPPITASLLGMVPGHPRISEENYKKHLREKYL